MGFFTEVNKIVKEVTGITELEEEKNEYEQIAKEYNDLIEKLNNKIILYNEQTNRINKERKSCIDLMNLYGLIDKKNKNVNIEKIESIIEKNNYDLNKIKSGSTIASLISGGVLSFGLYSAASVFGVASTGTAIATLSGAAATNATLAFLGGGALAIGGGGMAAGTTVLGVMAI